MEKYKKFIDYDIMHDVHSYLTVYSLRSFIEEEYTSN